MMDNGRERVVIAGAAMATCLGLSTEQTWQAILSGKCGMGPMTAMESPLPPGRDGGQAMELPAGFAPGLPREVRYLRWTIAGALKEAQADAHLPYAPQRCGFLLGTTIHGMRSAGQFLRSDDETHLRDFLAGDTLRRAAAGWSLTGLAATTCAACSSGLTSVAMAVTLLQSRQFDLLIAGGYDAISEYVYAGFNSLRLVSEGPVRPFARDRQGMKLAEGYGILVLERESDARARGIKPLARILGYGESSDAHHLTQPHPQGEGAARAMAAALSSGGVNPQRIGLIAAHGTATPDNDAGEHAAMSSVFGEYLPRVPVVAFKSFLGHTLGGAGAVELVLSAMAIRDQVVPACANVRAEDVAFPGLNLATGSPRPAAIEATLNSSLGFGGSNSSMVLGHPDGAGQPPHPVSLPVVHVSSGDGSGRDVVISGIGVVLPGAVGSEDFIRMLNRPAAAWASDAGAIPEEQFIQHLAARRVRRMSEYVKLTLASASLACADAGVAGAAGFGENCCVVLGTTHGATRYCEDYYAQIVREGVLAANPMLFAEGVPNAAAAQLSLMLSLKGGCQTLIGTRTAALDALALAAARIRSGEWDRVLVGAAEEHGSLVNRGYRACGLYAAGAGCAPFSGEAGFVTGSGAVMLVLESRAACGARGGRARARVIDTHTAVAPPAGTVEALAGMLGRFGNPGFVIGSANGTWVDRAEAAALRSSPAVVSSMYGYVPECFSVSPLAGIAAVLLSGRMPALPGGGMGMPGGRPARGDERPSAFSVLCTGYSGSVAGACLQML